MLNNNLDEEEIEILDAFNSGRLKSTANVSHEIKMHQAYAASTINKKEPVLHTFFSKIQRMFMGYRGQSLSLNA